MVRHESLRDYWKRRAEESASRVGTVSPGGSSASGGGGGTSGVELNNSGSRGTKPLRDAEEEGGGGVAMAASTRHIQRQRLRDTAKSNDSDEEAPRSVFGGGGGRANHRRFPSGPPPPSLTESAGVLDALSDETSDLARFLFVKGGGGREWNANDGSSWFKSIRRLNSGDSNGEDDMPSMGLFNTSFFALALEPMEIRNERIIMLFEAYAIFGALFMGAIWILYEWGSPNGYGGENSDVIVQRIFGFFIALALGVNGLLALFGAIMWILSINLNSSHEDYVFESRKALAYLDTLLSATFQLFFVGLVLGTYLNMSPHWPETIVAMVIFAGIYFRGIEILWQHLAAIAPLECYHFTGLWGKSSFQRLFCACRGHNKEIKPRAKLRAQALKKRAYRERMTMDPNFRASSVGASSVGGLLRRAAVNLGMVNCDISIYEDRLKDDWFNEAVQLKHRGVACLSRYMPLRLGEEVHRLLETEYSEA